MVQTDHEAKRLTVLKQYDILNTPREDAFDELTSLAAQIFAVPIVAISIIDSDRQWFKSSVGLEISQTERSISFCTHTIEQTSPLTVEDTTKDPRFTNNPLVMGDLGIKFYAGIPLITKSGFALGSFCLMDHVPRQMTDSNSNLLKAFAQHVIALFEYHHESKNLQELVKEREQETPKFQDYAEHLSNAQQIAKIGSWELAINKNVLLWSDEVYHIFNLDIHYKDLTFEKFLSFVHKDDLSIVLAAQDNVLKGNCKLNLEHRIVLDDGTERYVHELGEIKHNPNGDRYLCGTVQDVTEKKAAERKMHYLAFYDTLTGLPNRQLLFDRLTQALAIIHRESNRGALIYLDLDNFKLLNDTLGHDMGDLLLKNVAMRFSASLRQVDTVARVGGDEFVILLSDLSVLSENAVADAKTVANHILKTLQEPFQLNNHTYYVTASIGIAMISERTQDVEVLLKRADLAMYKAKSLGKNSFEFFDHDLQANALTRSAIENDLRQAINDDQFQLYYQPQMDQNRQIIGCEALIRWFHPVNGLISPAEFIPIAEETGLIIPIGLWVLDTACKQLKEWQLNNKSYLTVSINVSAKQFARLDFVEGVLSTIYKYDIDPTKLRLELTEGMLIDNQKDIIIKMERLKRHGITFSLDDFGTGYSSLNYLAKLPLDELKIDQSFVREMMADKNSAVIVKTIISLGQSLGLCVIAEGVETAEQEKLLVDHKCNFYQGYFYCKPIPNNEINKLIENLNE